ncbi:hypothetical protein A9G24_06940 [Gilliamella sp. App6-5]|uniref:hypothetical protein n=1 Tax=Gilliamella sp. App6-5 TaxID=3120232 RepID=UPI00080EB658|nr:hypothetical protein [Gilliamella apicola]OCG13839.1 hypothetical protein A9G24_06940 [Gilliamella apicola]
MKIPTYLQKYAVDIKENDPDYNGLTSLYIQSSNKEQWFEIYYYGELYNGYITGTEPTFCNMKVIAKSIESKEEILLFDATEYGYNGMFCDGHSKEEKKNRPLTKLDVPASRIKLAIGYGIDYEEEKEDFDFDENGHVILIDDRRITWQNLQHDGFDWLYILLIDKNGDELEVVNEELA